jgi:hypothetical protein
MTQALYAHMNNKKIKIKKKRNSPGCSKEAKEMENIKEKLKGTNDK